MGRSLNINHVLNVDKLTKAQFKKQFTDMIKAKGYTSAKEDDAELCYELVFSADRKWMTILSEDDTEAKNKASAFARDLGMQVLSVELVDSDFAELTLFGLNGSPVDTMFLGEPYFDEVPEPSPLKWQTMLGIDWAKVEEIQQGDHTFAEDALCEFGEIIGCDNMLAEFGEGGDNAVRVYFKKGAQKKLTLNLAFKQVFGELLEPLGFVKLKGKNTFIRPINNEIFHVINMINITAESQKCTRPILENYPETRDMNTFATPCVFDDKGNVDEMMMYTAINYHGLDISDRSKLCDGKKLKYFDILGKVTSIYDENAFIGGHSISEMYLELKDENYDNDFRSKIRSFAYEDGNDRSLYAAMVFVSDLLKKYILPTFEDVESYDDMLMYWFKYIMWPYDEWFILTDNYRKLHEKWFEIEKKNIIKEYNDLNRSHKKTLEEKLNIFRGNIEKTIESIDNIFSDKVTYDKYMNSFEINKQRNLEIIDESQIFFREDI